jgi:DUF4097 and DUF4098 domain-containing protein YvlB
VYERARARIAAARERVAAAQEKLSAAEEKITEAEKEGAGNPWESIANALHDLPGARAVSEALRDPSRLASSARRQARRVARQVRSAVGDLNFDFNFGEAMQGEPTLSAPREAIVALNPGTMLRVRNPLGDIEAIGADVPEARIAGVLKIWAQDRTTAEQLAEQITLSVDQGAEGPTVIVNHGAKSRRIVLDLKVFVPQNGAKVSLLSPAGDVTVRNHKGNVVLATQSGDAKASEIVGDVAAETASGDIAVEGVVGNIQASSASGDIQAIRLSGQNFRAIAQSGDVTLREASIPVVNIETVSGDAETSAISGQTLRVRTVSGDAQVRDVAFTEEMRLDTVSGFLGVEPRGPLNAGSLTIITVSGDAEVKLPKAADASIEVNTKSGDVTAKFLGAEGVEKTMNGSGMVSLSETVGGGAGARITVTTVSGNLTVSQESPVIEM